MYFDHLSISSKVDGQNLGEMKLWTGGLSLAASAVIAALLCADSSYSPDSRAPAHGNLQTGSSLCQQARVLGHRLVLRGGSDTDGEVVAEVGNELDAKVVNASDTVEWDAANASLDAANASFSAPTVFIPLLFLFIPRGHKSIPRKGTNPAAEMVAGSRSLNSSR